MDLKNIFHTQEQRDDFMQTMLEATGEMIVIFDKNLHILMLNKNCEKKFNVKDEDVRGKNLFEIFPHVKGSQSHKDLLKALAGDTVSSSKKSSDNKIYIGNKVIPLKSPQGEIIVVMVMARDITSHVDSNVVIREANDKIEEQNSTLQDSSNFLENFTNTCNDLIMMLNKNTEFVAVNSCAREMLELYSPVIIGKKIEEVIPHFKSSEAWGKLNESLAGKASVLKEHNLVPNEKYWEINIRPLYKNNTIESVMIICHDITEIVKTKKELEESNVTLRDTIEELRISEDRYHRMVEEVQDYAIILLDHQGNIQNWNKGAERIKGYKASDVMGKNINIFYTEDDLKSKLPLQILEKAKTLGKAEYEGWRVRKGGQLFWGSISLTALKDKHQKLFGFSKVTRDLTEKKITDDNLQKQAEILVQKNADLEKLNKELQAFAYVASHDLQEPLRKIQFFANLILQKEAINLSDTGKDHFRRMQEASKRMQTLIEDLLSFSRTNNSEKDFEKLDLKKIVNEVLYEMREAINEKAAKITVGDMIVAEIIPFQFRQLMQNLVSNALKFSNLKEAPKIEIFTSVVVDADVPHMLPTKNIKYIKLTVKDNGIGFEPEYKERIFDIFQRLHGKHEYKGTGIGLAICKKIAENHNGLIMAEGLPDVGASFIVYLPTTQPVN